MEHAVYLGWTEIRLARQRQGEIQSVWSVLCRAAAVFPLTESKALFVSISAAGAPPSLCLEQVVSTLSLNLTASVRIFFIHRTGPVSLETTAELTCYQHKCLWVSACNETNGATHQWNCSDAQLTSNFSWKDPTWAKNEEESVPWLLIASWFMQHFQSHGIKIKK